MSFKTARKVMIFTFIVIILFGLYITYAHTNLINKVKGDTFSQQIQIESVTNGTDGGFIRVIRSEETPITYEWAKFDNEEKYTYFSIDENKVKQIPIYITIPTQLEKGTYDIELEIKYNSGKTILKTIDFMVI